MTVNCVVYGIGGQPFVCNLYAVQGGKSANCSNKDKCRKCGRTGHLPEILPLFSRREIPEIFRPLAHPPRLQKQVALMPLLFLMTVDSQFLKDNELDLVQSQSILRDLDPAGSSVDEGSI